MYARQGSGYIARQRALREQREREEKERQRAMALRSAENMRTENAGLQKESRLRYQDYMSVHCNNIQAMPQVQNHIRIHPKSQEFSLAASYFPETSEPTTSSTKYSEPIQIGEGETTVNAVAINNLQFIIAYCNIARLATAVYQNCTKYRIAFRHIDWSGIFHCFRRIFRKLIITKLDFFSKKLYHSNVKKLGGTSCIEYVKQKSWQIRFI